MVSNSVLFLELLLLVSFNIPFSYSSVLDFVHPLCLVLISPHPLFLFRLGPKISGRDLLLVEECCNAPDPMRQVSPSYSLSLPCHLLACCILPCHHLHFISCHHVHRICIRVRLMHPSFFPVVRFAIRHSHMHRRTPLVSFRERVLNVLGMDRVLPSGLGLPQVDQLSSFVPFAGRLMLQRLTG